MAAGPGGHVARRVGLDTWHVGTLVRLCSGGCRVVTRVSVSQWVTCNGIKHLPNPSARSFPTARFQVLVWLAQCHAAAGDPSASLSCVGALREAGSELAATPEMAAVEARWGSLGGNGRRWEAGVWKPSRHGLSLGCLLFVGGRGRRKWGRWRRGWGRGETWRGRQASGVHA